MLQKIWSCNAHLITADIELKLIDYILKIAIFKPKSIWSKNAIFIETQ